MCRDKQNGQSRKMLTLALANMSKPEVEDVLVELLNDPDVAGHAIIALDKRGTLKSIPQIEMFLQHSVTWIRNAAKKALANIQKRRGTGARKKKS